MKMNAKTVNDRLFLEMSDTVRRVTFYFKLFGQRDLLQASINSLINYYPTLVIELWNSKINEILGTIEWILWMYKPVGLYLHFIATEICGQTWQTFHSFIEKVGQMDEWKEIFCGRKGTVKERKITIPMPKFSQAKGKVLILMTLRGMTFFQGVKLVSSTFPFLPFRSVPFRQLTLLHLHLIFPLHLQIYCYYYYVRMKWNEFALITWK